MGRKLQWYKMYADEAMADQKIGEISWAARGVLWFLWNFLYTQTDEPGRFIVNGKIWTETDIGSVMVRISRGGHGTKHTQKKHLGGYVFDIVKAGLIVKGTDGVLYSPRIVEEVDRSQKAQKGGLVRGGEFGDRSGDRFGDRAGDRNKNKNKNKKEYGHRREDPSLPKLVESIYREPTPLEELVEAGKEQDRAFRAAMGGKEDERGSEG